MRMLPLVLAWTLLSAGCSASLTSPSSVPLRVTVEATPTLVGGTDTAMFTMRVENASEAVVELTFPSSCQLLPYFVDRRTGQLVTPRGGGVACLTVITQRTLRVGESFSQVVSVRAGDAPLPPFVVLPPGDYAIYARLEDQRYRLTSRDLSFTLR